PQEAPSSPDSAPAVAAPQLEPSEQPATSKRPRRAEPATHFGSRARPPGGQTRALDLTPKPVEPAPAPEQPAAASEQPPVPEQSVTAPEKPAPTPERQEPAAPQ